MSFVVEFAGAPGAGKSTLCRGVAAALASAGVTVDDRSLPAGSAARTRRLARKGVTFAAALRRPARVVRVARACRRAGLGGRELVARTANLVVLDATCRRPGPAVVLVDQGIAQEVTSVAVTADHVALLDSLPDDLSSAVDVVVRVRVPADVAAHRLRARGTCESRAERLAPTDLDRAIDDAEAVLDALLGPDVASGTRSVEVWEVDGSDPASVSDLAARIRRPAGR